MKINGNLVFNTDATGEVQNAYIERLSAAPTFNASEKGRIYFNTTSALYYFNDGAQWSPFATGGNAATLQTEVDAIETALGSVVGANGVFNAAAFSGTPIITAAGSVTAAITALANYANGKDQLSELSDVVFASLANGQYLKYNSSTSKWVNETLVLADVTDVTATAAEVNVLTGITASTAELNFTTGVTSAIQTQLNNKQPLDATLTSLASLHGTGIVVETSQDVFTNISLTAPAAGITIANASGAAGSPTFALADDLAALEGLTGAGYAVRTGTSTWTNRTITGQAGRVVVTNGDGVLSNTDLDLATVTDGATGTFLKFTRDAYGRVSGTTAVVLSDITGLADSTYVNVTGDTMSGSLTFSAGTVTGLPDPVNASDAANKNYVDSSIAGLTWKNSTAVATTANGTLATAFAAGQVVDGYTLVLGDRILIKNQTTGTENGIYVVTAGAPTRATDADTGAELNHATVFVEHGTAQAATAWTVNNATTPVVGTDVISFVQFNGASSVVAGVGLAKTGNTIDVNLGAGIVELPTDEVGIDLYSTVNALRLTTDGSTASTATDAKLTLVLKATNAGITQDSNGLYIPAAGVLNSMLLHSSMGLNADSGSGTLNLGDTMYIVGTSTQGIGVTVASAGATSTYTVTAADAAYAQKGVASFDTNDFTVTAGAVSIKTAGVDNAQLAHSVISYVGDAGTPVDVALGSTLNIKGEASTAVTTSITGNTVSVAVADATSTVKGLASFNTTDFSVATGAVSLVAKNISSLTDVAVTSAAAGQTLVYVAGTTNKFVNRQTYFLYTGGSSTTHTVTHNLGQQYCNVTVVDATDEVVIPQSITFSGANSLVVTFTSAIACKVIVMGVNAA